MYNSIRGIVSGKTDSVLWLDNQGVEYEILATRATLAGLEAGVEARVWVHLVHREDAMRLYGFSALTERALFLDLIKVDGLGPKLAMKILSSIPADELGQAIEAGDADRLAAVPGLGQKTAQKLILNLKGKLVPPAGDGGSDELVNALAGMGFDKQVAREAVRKAAAEQGNASEEEIFRRALQLASRGGKL